MKVFISWSGERSRKVGELLDEWLKCVIQAIDPWRSDRDIDRGSMWFSQITNQLQETSMGIICITQENKNNPWILFESGALSKGLSSNRIFTFLIDLEHTDIKDPLAQFNHTIPLEESVKGLVRTLNSTLDDKRLPEKILDEVFKTYWPQFKDKFKDILEATPVQEIVVPRTENDILSEILERTRAMDRRLSYVERENGKKEHNELNNFIKKPMVSKKVLDVRVKSLLDDGMSTEEIIEIINEKYTVPVSSILSVIKMQLTQEE